MKTTLSLTILMMCVALFPLNLLADDASVLPKGNFSLNLAYMHYLPWDERYDKDGHVEDAAVDYNAVLDSSVFPDLAMFDGFVPGSPNLGKTVTSFDYDYERIDIRLAYGLTDKISVGIKVPFIRYKNKVKAELDTTEANLGKNNLFLQGVLPEEYDSLPLLPLGTPGLPEGTVTPLTSDDVQSLLGEGLAINGIPAIPGYGYDRFETWEEQGLGDIEAGLKYRYHQSDRWQLAVLGGIILPTGEGYDPDSLQAQQLGGDTYSLAFHSYNDYTAIRNLTLNGSLLYTLTLPHDDDRRIVRDPHEPLTDLVESVDIDPGDLIEIETSATYQFDENSALYGTALQLLYNYTKGFKDDISGPGPDSTYAGLERESDGELQFITASIAYSTIPLFLKKEFSVPMDFSLSYRDKFAGTNGTFKTRYVQASMTVYF